MAAQHGFLRRHCRCPGATRQPQWADRKDLRSNSWRSAHFCSTARSAHGSKSPRPNKAAPTYRARSKPLAAASARTPRPDSRWPGLWPSSLTLHHTSFSCAARMDRPKWPTFSGNRAAHLLWTRAGSSAATSRRRSRQRPQAAGAETNRSLDPTDERSSSAYNRRT